MLLGREVEMFGGDSRACARSLFRVQGLSRSSAIDRSPAASHGFRTSKLSANPARKEPAEQDKQYCFKMRTLPPYTVSPSLTHSGLQSEIKSA